MILFFDTETTGLPNRRMPPEHPDQPKIVQLAAILDDDAGKEVMRLDVIFHRDHIPDHVASLHGITTEYSQRYGVNEEAGLDIFFDMLEAADVVVGQNVKGFDIGIVTGAGRQVFNDVEFEPFKDKTIFDTMHAGQAMGLRKANLTAIHTKLFGVPFEGAHNAITDVLACRRCFYRFQEMVREKRGGA